MKQASDIAQLDWDAERIHCRGRWTVDALGAVAHKVESWTGPTGASVTLDAGAVTALDTAGAWVLRRLQLRAAGQNEVSSIEGLSAPFADLFARVSDMGEVQLPQAPQLSGLAQVGRQAWVGLENLYSFMSFFGAVMTRGGVLLMQPWRIRWRALWVDVYESGVMALGIVGMLSFLMGVVFAYQGAVQLKAFGANIYIADLIGLSMTRELGPILAAIIVAGRTGSAYTAQIGTMQITEEVAALRTIGIDPMDLLVIPRVLSLCIALPLLTVFADLAGIVGGMLLAKLQMGLGFAPFIDRLQEAVSARSFLLGICKTPVFALIIAMIGCYQGFRVSGSAASVGQHTTLSVVQSIFLVIVADAQFSVLFSWLGI